MYVLCYINTCHYNKEINQYKLLTKQCIHKILFPNWFATSKTNTTLTLLRAKNNSLQCQKLEKIFNLHTSYFWSLQPFKIFTGPLFQITLHLKSSVTQWIYPLSKAVPGNFHGSGKHSKQNCLQDQTNFHGSWAWQIVLIFNIVFATSSHVLFLIPRDVPYLVYADPVPAGHLVLGMCGEGEDAVSGMCPVVHRVKQNGRLRGWAQDLEVWMIYYKHHQSTVKSLI